MDFHSFARRDLQALCKKNKIPANLTNVAMADALKALQKVEGLDEFRNAQHSPERSANAEPRTAGRTSTRRKPVDKVEAESSQILTRSRRTTRRVVADNESKNVDLPKTPAPNNSRRGAAASTRRKIDSQLSECSEVQEKSDMGKAKTPAAVYSRRKVKTQKDEKSVPIVSSKRQSVRLLEKTMAGLTLKEERKVEAVKIEGLCDETEQVEQAKDKDMPDESLENECEKYEAVENSKPIDDEVDQLAENECEMVDEEDKSEVVDFDERENIDEFLGNESETKVELAEDSGAKLETETCANSDDLTGLDDAEDNDDSSDTDIQVENSDKAIDMIHESIDEKGSDVEITENPEKMMNSDLEKEIEKESEYESNDNSPIEMEAEEHDSITDVLDEISDLVKQTEDWSKSLEMNQQPMQKADELDAIDAQISVDLEDWDKTTQSSVEQKSPSSPNLVSGSENAAAKMATSDEQKSPFSHLVSDSEIAAAAAEMTTSDDELGDIVEMTSDNEFDGIVETCLKAAKPCVSSPFADNTIQGQFPRPTVEKKKMILVDDDANMNIINKENNMGESEGGKLSNMSLRQLTKAVKEQLQIKNKNASKVGEIRTALQKLPENAAEAEAEI